jgi:hypothetical protein
MKNIYPFVCMCLSPFLHDIFLRKIIKKESCSPSYKVDPGDLLRAQQPSGRSSSPDRGKIFAPANAELSYTEIYTSSLLYVFMA